MSKLANSPERIDISAVLGATRASPRARLLRRAVRWGLPALALALAAFWWLGRGSGSATVRYVTEPAARGTLVVTVTATGSVQPTNKVDVSSELSGTVRRVLVDYNSRVKAGDVLAELDTDKLKASVDSTRARLAAALAKLADTEATIIEKRAELTRKQTLQGKQFASAQDLDLAKATYDRAIAARDSAKAEVAAATADVQLNETNLTKALIRSPIDGVVLKRNVDPGATVAASLQAPVLFSIAEDLARMELQVDVDEADVGQVRPGQSATFGVDAFPDRKFPARIRDVRFASETIQGVVTYKAVLTVDNSELLLRPGMTATAEIRVTEIADALLVPNAALRYTPPVQAPQQSLLRRIMPGPPAFRPASVRDETGANRTVYALRDGQPAAVKVVIGASDGKRTEIKSGELAPGTALVTDQTASR